MIDALRALTDNCRNETRSRELKSCEVLANDFMSGESGCTNVTLSHCQVAHKQSRWVETLYTSRLAQPVQSWAFAWRIFSICEDFLGIKGWKSGHPYKVEGCPQYSVLGPQSSVLSPQSSFLNPKFSILNLKSPRSSIPCPQSSAPSILNPQSTVFWKHTVLTLYTHTR